MARRINRLTAVGVSKATKPGYHADGAGLYLRVGPTGSKHWSFRYRMNGRLYDLGLGPVHTVSLSDARHKALELRKQRLAGVDPRAHRRQQQLTAANAVTFKECTERYIASHKAGWAAKSVNGWSNTMRDHVLPIIGDQPVSAIDVGLVMRVLEPIWTTKTETASRLRSKIENVLDWAGTRGYRAGENPARWRGHLENLLPKKSKVRRAEHHAALPYNKVGEFISMLRRRDGTSYRAIEFVILTAARAGEVVGARWPEVDFDRGVWTIPAERMKGRREHRVPLSGAAITLLEKLNEVREGEFVFPGMRAGQHLSDRAMLAALERDPDYTDITVHGFRSTFRDWAAEETSYPNEVAEMALAHAVPDGVERAYRRGDLFERRRQMMEEWARYCEKSIT